MSSSYNYQIEGGYPIYGELTCVGAKNLATKAMIASLLTDEEVILTNMPNIGDVEITAFLLRSLGSEISQDGSTMVLRTSHFSSFNAQLRDSRTNRMPILLLAPLLHRIGKGVVPIVGGDMIGARKVDFHVNAIAAFGGTIELQDNCYVVHSSQRLKGCHLTLPYPSVGATEATIFLSVLAEGTSLIRNIAIEPEIIALISMLNSMGAQIFIRNNRELLVYGVERLRGAKMEIIGDRIEAASWATLACASNGKIVVHGVDHILMNNFLPYFTMAGGGYRFVDKNSIEFYRVRQLESIVLETDVFPGFSTDLQQPFCTLLTQAHGMSAIHETVYESRFGYLDVLNKLGANTQVVKHCLGSPCRYHGCDYSHSALINGPTRLVASPSPIYIPDIRAGLAYLIASILADGTTELTNAHQLERGYGDLIVKLANTNLRLYKL